MDRRPIRSVLTALFVIGLPMAATAQTAAGQAAPMAYMGYEQADVRSVLRFLGDYGGVNIVQDVGVTGNVNMQLRNVTWLEAFGAVLSQLDLVSIPSVATLETGVPEETRFITVMKRTDFNTRQTQMLAQEKDVAQSQPLVTEIVKLSNSRASEMTTALDPLKSPDGFVQPDTRTNSLIIRDYPDNLDLLREVIRNLDVPVRQVRIEAKLLEVDSDRLNEMGLQWDLNMGGANPLIITQATDRVSTPTITGGMNFTSGNLTLDATISMLQSEGVANIVATPSISVLDNSQGTVFMGEQIPLRQLDVAGNVTIQLQQVGTELIVTPHIVQNDEIILELAPKRESFRVDASAGIIITTQNATTTVTVRDGETAVIGGLKSTTETVADTGVPILMDIPLIGNLFRYRTRQVQVRDLILFVTPRIERGTGVNLP